MSLETDHFGKWVLVHDEKLVDIYSSFEETAQDAVEPFRAGSISDQASGRATDDTACFRAV